MTLRISQVVSLLGKKQEAHPMFSSMLDRVPDDRPDRSPRGRGPYLAASTAAITAAVITATTTPGLAHSDFVGSSPAQGTTVADPPEQVRLGFSDEILIDFATVTVTVGDRPAVKLEPVVNGSEVFAEVPGTMPAPAPGISKAPWVLDYRIVSGDGHPIDGRVRWTVKYDDRPTGTGPSSSPAPTDSRTGAVEVAPEGDPPPLDSSATSPDGSGGGAWWLLALPIVVAAAALLLRRGRRLRDG